MKTVTKLDSRRRGVFPLPFRPGDILVQDAKDADSITFRVVRPAEAPLVRPVQSGGMLMLPAKSVSRESIAQAVRAGRDED